MIAFIVLPVLLAPVRTLQVTGWRLDWPSLIAGLLLGAALLLLFYRFRRRLREIRDSSVSRVQETQAWVRAGVEKRFQAETARYVARCHLGRPWATLEQIFVPPLLIDGAPLADPEAPAAPSTGQLLYLWRSGGRDCHPTAGTRRARAVAERAARDPFRRHQAKRRCSPAAISARAPRPALRLSAAYPAHLVHSRAETARGRRRPGCAVIAASAALR